MTRYVRIGRMVEVSGYTEAAIRGKIATGVWVEGVHYRRAPDNRLVIDLDAYERWIEGRHTFTAVNQLLAQSASAAH